MSTELTSEERVYRDRRYGPDPFFTSAPSPPRMQLPINTNDNARSFNRHQSGVPVGIGGHPARGIDGNRQSSGGPIWHVGGASQAGSQVIGVSDGRGGMLRSGSNAPLYRSIYEPPFDDAARSEAHERRIALAFDLDETSRILGPLQSPEIRTGKEDISPNPSVATHAWANNEWIPMKDKKG